MEKETLKHSIQIIKSLSEQSTIEGFFKSLLNVCFSHTQANYCLLMLIQNEQLLLQAEALGSEEGIFHLQTLESVTEHHTSLTLAASKMPAFVLEPCIKKHKCLVIDDFSKYADDDYVKQHAPYSAVCLPIVLDKNLKGIVYLESRKSKHAFPPETVGLLQLLAPLMGPHLENLEKYAELQLQNDSLEKEGVLHKELIYKGYYDIQLLAELGREIASNLDLTEIIEASYKSISMLMDASIFTLGIYNEPNQSIDLPITIERGERLGFHSIDLKEDVNRLAVWCFKNEKEVFIGNYQEEFSSYFPGIQAPAPKLGEVPLSVIYVPVQVKNNTIGVITVQCFVLHAYTKFHLNFLRNLAIYVGIALENAEAYKRIQEQKKLLEQSFTSMKLLGEMGQDITANLDVEKIIETVYTNINALIDAPILSIGIYNELNQTLDVQGSIERNEKLPFHAYSMDEDNRIAVYCFKQLREVIINHLEEEYQLYMPNSPVPKADLGELPESLIYLPLIGKDKTIGVLSVQSFKRNAYSPNEVNLVRNLAIYVGIALENAEAYKRIESSNKAVAEQKLLIEHAYQDIKELASIGQDIMASLSVEKIIATVYEKVNALMEASVFWIGIYNEGEQIIDFKGGKEKGNTLPDFQISLSQEDRLATWCFNHQEEVLINNVQIDYPKYIPQRKRAVVGQAAESIVYLPLSVKNKRMGVITVQSFNSNAYSGHHLNILRNLVNYIFTALENALLYENMEEQVRARTTEVVLQKEALEKQRDQLNQSFQDIKLLSEIGQDITGLLSTADIIRAAYHNANSLMDAAVFGIGILDRKKGQIVFRGAIEVGELLPDFIHDANDEMRFSSWAITNQREVFINDFHNEYNKYIPEMKKAAAGGEPSSIIYLPLSTKKSQIGVLTVQSFATNSYQPYHLDILKNLAVYIAIALENAEAYREIEAQSAALEKANSRTTASINYAKRIQDAILPQENDIQQFLPEFFAFFKPRDIVSGDFYWFREQHRKLFLGAMDCTGHGVPGAFMSMVGNDHLNEIVSYLNFEEPHYILSELNTSVRDTLKQDSTDRRDGMDIGFCVIDKYAQRLYFSGAKMPLVYVRRGQLYTIDGDKQSIGGQQREVYRSFTKHAIDIYPGDMFYMFSDGFHDQFGGPLGRKMLSKNFKQLLLRIHHLSIDAQKEALDNALHEWMGDMKQTDDIMVLGFRM